MRGMERVGIIGAGLAGLTAAAELAAAGRAVTVFDKSRGTGGRLATRRTGAGAFDHGAPAAHGGAAFGAAMERLGAVRSGRGWIARPGMSALVKPLERGVEIRKGVRIVEAWERSGWHLRDAEGEVHGPFATLICAIPAPQAADLFPGAALPGVTMTPRWTLMAAFEEAVGPEEIPVPFEGMHHAAPHRVVVHAGPDWSAAHLEREEPEVRAALVARLREAVGGLSPVFAAAHRWRFARTGQALGRPVLQVSETCWLGGDWTLGAEAGDAWESGRALARAALGKAAPVA